MGMDNLSHMLQLSNVKTVYRNKRKCKAMSIAIADMCALQDWQHQPDTSKQVKDFQRSLYYLEQVSLA